ncbi:hypothetical protein EDC01DRAFT_647120 [Geopyxis carbonaria]|nr:hypothetical protein EDC01DRAFT_647120 [Geopyxis carbonaria]
MGGIETGFWWVTRVGLCFLICRSTNVAATRFNSGHERGGDDSEFCCVGTGQRTVSLTGSYVFCGFNSLKKLVYCACSNTSTSSCLSATSARRHLVNIHC